jgi:WD40 repeat protein
LKAWDAVTGNCRQTLEGHQQWVNSAAISPDGTTIASTSSDKTVRLWDLATGRCRAVLEGHTDWVHHALFTPDGRLLVSAGSDGTVRVWEVATGKSVRVLRTPFSLPAEVAENLAGGSGEAAPSEGRKEGAPGGLTQCMLTPDGRKVIAAGRAVQFCIWDLADGKCLHTLSGHEKYVECLALTPDGRLLVSGSQDTTLRVWDVATGMCRHKLEGHFSDVEGVVVTPDGRFAVSASRDYTIRVWDLATGGCVRVLQGHQFGVTGVTMTPDGQHVVSSSWDNTIRVWVLATGECLTAYHAGARVAYATVDGEGRVFCGASDGQVHFLKLRNVTPGVPVVTGVRVYRVGKPEAERTFLEKLLPFFGGAGSGSEGSVTFVCPTCGTRGPVPTKVLEAIHAVAKAAQDQAPCVALPGEAWNDPRLGGECPECKQAVRFNPYVVGGGEPREQGT